VRLKPNTITLSGSKLVADRFEAGPGPDSKQLASGSLDDNCQTPTDITAMRRVCTMDIVTSSRQSAGF